MSNNNLKIRLSVDSFYDSISKKKQKTKIDPKRLSKSLGYDEKLLMNFLMKLIWGYHVVIQLII